MNTEEGPYIPLDWNDLHSINNILLSYLAYLHGGMAPSPERNTKLQVAYLLRGRVNLLLAIRYENSKLTVTFEEAAVLQDAMLVSIDLISHVIPQTPERDGVIETVQNLRKMLAETLLPPIE